MLKTQVQFLLCLTRFELDISREGSNHQAALLSPVKAHPYCVDSLNIRWAREKERERLHVSTRITVECSGHFPTEGQKWVPGLAPIYIKNRKSV